ncbi:MFS transporter [Georgenia alba]|uniref:Nitrate/nitrite transporter n=1 Tax=Georgenia alba TaxID=2233858 RepID=A0ABW2Q5E6_9MICO
MTAPRAATETWRALAVWAVGLAAYVVAVTGRTSLGVAGLEAVDRFGISASVLATFSVVQLGVYAAAQIPAGMLLDRLGSRTLIASGALVLAVGQLLLAAAETVPVALCARLLIGLGDAMTLISVLRLVVAWFPSRRVPLLTQLTAMLGQLGQVVSALPFAVLLRTEGWAPAFATLGGSGVLVAVLVIAAVRDRPAERGRTPEVPGSRGGVVSVLRRPESWQGFFAHLLTLFPANSFLFLWGMPFLTVGQGLPATVAGALISATVVVGFVVGPTVGVLTGRFPHRRVVIVLATVTCSTLAWCSVLLPSGPRPLWQLALLMLAVGAGVATCSIGFDFPRTALPPQDLGTATGMVNVGGYSGSLLAVLLMGLVLDVLAPSGDFGLADLRMAFAAQGFLLALGLVGLAVALRAGRRRAATPSTAA